MTVAAAELDFLSRRLLKEGRDEGTRAASMTSP